MKWPTQKSSSLITRVFSKFKRNSSSKTSKINNATVLDFPSPNSSFYREGRFYSLDEDDAYWRISFGADDRILPRRSTGGINPLWQDSDNDIENQMLARLGLAQPEVPKRNFSDMVSDIKRIRESRGKQRVKDEREGCMCIESKDSRKPTKNPKFGQDCRDDRRLIRDIKVKTKPSVRRTKEKSSRAVKAYSPRTECKIRALEEMRKARTNAKKKERLVDVDTVFDSFAVVKSSVDPHRDFKDSMVEMIREKGIGHPNDLEELLACYLTLNCDEYHDLIISVFQQVWIELKGLTKNVSYFD